MPRPNPQWSIDAHDRLISKLFRVLWARHGLKPKRARTNCGSHHWSGRDWKIMRLLASPTQIRRGLSCALANTCFLLPGARPLHRCHLWFLLQRHLGQYKSQHSLAHRSTINLDIRCTSVQRRPLGQQVPWHSKLLLLVAKPTKQFCRASCNDWAMERTEEITIQAQACNSAPVWQLANTLRISKCRPRVAVEPIVDSDGTIVINREHLGVLWAQQFAAEFSGHVAGMAPSQMSRLLVERQSRPLGPAACELPLYHTSSGLPQTLDEELDFVQAWLPNIKSGKQVGLDCIPNELYIKAGNPSQLQVARLLQSAKNGRPIYVFERRVNVGCALKSVVDTFARQL